ncbi:hypothetical protein M9Y10_041259 [Tritrichomonas musculus]|uniref:Uncharacterized protein n=1 Tax=Tritrichomonas musculus TaxID=1915356 RepID=A0ABR2K3W4_9EUKA
MKTRSKNAIPQDYIEEIFDVFLFEDPSKLHFLSSKVNDPYLFNTDCEMFVELFLLYSYSFATELTVERYLSNHKYVHSNKMTNISKCKCSYINHQKKIKNKINKT